MKRANYFVVVVRILAICTLLISSLNGQSPAEKPKVDNRKSAKNSAGFFTGWSFGVGEVFEGYNYKRAAREVRASFHFGLFFQFAVSKTLGLQFEMHLQNVTNKDTTYGYFLYGESEVTYSSGILGSFNLNIVNSLKRYKNKQGYFLFGLGYNAGAPIKGHDTPLNFKLGFGVRSFCFKAKPCLALIYRATFCNLFNITEHNSGAYFSISVGIESMIE